MFLNVEVRLRIKTLTKKALFASLSCRTAKLFFFLSNQNENFSLCSPYHAEVCNEFLGPSPQLLQTKQLLWKRCYSGSKPLAPALSDLTGPRFKPQTFGIREERVTPFDQLAGLKLFSSTKSVRLLLVLKKYTVNSGLMQGWIHSSF